MKRTTLFLSLLMALGSTSLYAGQGRHKGHHTDDWHVVKARVIAVTPITERVSIPSEQRECWDEEVRGTHTQRSGGGALMGAIIGGVIGHNVGDGHSRGVTTAVGTMIGASIGQHSDPVRHTPYSYTERHCEVRTDYHEEERISGYRVRYTFEGVDYESVLARDPGRFVRLRVSHQLLD